MRPNLRVSESLCLQDGPRITASGCRRPQPLGARSLRNRRPNGRDPARPAWGGFVRRAKVKLRNRAPSRSSKTAPAKATLNYRGVGPQPQYRAPPRTGRDPIRSARRRYPKAAGSPSPRWKCVEGSIPLDARALRPETCRRYPSGSDAIQAAVDRGLLALRNQRHRNRFAGVVR